jgi:hypothetical protein
MEALLKKLIKTLEDDNKKLREKLREQIKIIDIDKNIDIISMMTLYHTLWVSAYSMWWMVSR